MCKARSLWAPPHMCTHTHTDFYEIQKVACTWQKYSSPADSPWQKLPRHPLLRRCVHHHHTLPHCGARLTLLQARLNPLLCLFCITCFIFSLHFWPPCSTGGSQQSSLPGLLWSDCTTLLQPYFTSQQERLASATTLVQPAHQTFGSQYSDEETVAQRNSSFVQSHS